MTYEIIKIQIARIEDAKASLRKAVSFGFDNRRDMDCIRAWQKFIFATPLAQMADDDGERQPIDDMVAVPAADAAKIYALADRIAAVVPSKAKAQYAMDVDAACDELDAIASELAKI